MNRVDIVVVIMLALADSYGWENYDIKADPEAIRRDAIRVKLALDEAGLLNG